MRPKILRLDNFSQLEATGPDRMRAPKPSLRAHQAPVVCTPVCRHHATSLLHLRNQDVSRGDQSKIPLRLRPTPWVGQELGGVLAWLWSRESLDEDATVTEPDE